MTPPAAGDRRRLLADAAIDVLADRGAHGLSHHAVDDRAGLARGSTSYYFRTRHELVAAVFDRVTRLDTDDLVRLGAGGPLSVGDLAGLLVTWMSPAGQNRTRARIEVFAIASRDVVLQARVSTVTARMRRAARVLAVDLLPGADEDELEDASFCLLAVMDGALQQWTRESRETPTAGEVENLLRRACGAPARRTG